jgi:hypothetical protein
VLQICLFCVLFAIMPHKPRAAPIGGSVVARWLAARFITSGAARTLGAVHGIDP